MVDLKGNLATTFVPLIVTKKMKKSVTIREYFWF